MNKPTNEKNRPMPEGLAVRLVASQRLGLVLEGKQFVPFTRDELPEGRDRALANRLVTTALRRWGHLNVILKEVLERGVPKRSGNFEAVLRIGLTELLFMPEQAEHATLFLAVEAVKRDRLSRHLGKLINGVLRRVQRSGEQFGNLPKEDLLPDWLRQRWHKLYGADAIGKFADALLEGAPLDLTLREDDEELRKQLNAVPVLGDSVRIMERDRSVVDLPGFSQGRWWVQDVASAIPARLMAQPAGARVLDMCAAPGGKTAQLVKAGYEVTALDMDAGRLERVKQNLVRLEYNATLEQGDGTSYQAASKFDAILIDAPCTATGTFRRHPESIWHRRARDISDRVLLQRKLIETGVNCLVPGGVLVYSTCSLEGEEGEEQASWLVKSMPEVIGFPIMAEEVPGFEGALDENGWLRTWPGMQVPGIAGGTLDGFFVARFRRV